MNSTLVDLLLATYNGSRYLEDQLNSILAQTHQNFRLLVSDDGSSDETLLILEKFKDKFSGRLIVLPNLAPGGGVVRNFEKLMLASLSDGIANWIAFCDQDDFWRPEKIEVSLAEIRRIEGNDGDRVPCLVHSDLVVVDEKLMVICPSFAKYQLFNPRECSSLTLLSVNQVTGCAMMVNRTLLKMALPLPDQAIMHDWWCALISGGGRRSFIDTPLIFYRQHGANQIGAKDRRLHNRWLRFRNDAYGVLGRVRELGRVTYSQAVALQERFGSLGLNSDYIISYISWRRRGLLCRLLSYRKYYSGPELDRLSRLFLWSL